MLLEEREALFKDESFLLAWYLNIGLSEVGLLNAVIFCLAGATGFHRIRQAFFGI